MIKVTFLAPRFPPRVCGVGDHTQRMAETMLGQGVRVGFIHQDRQTEFDLPEGEVDFWDGGKKSLRECVDRQNPDWLWVQVSGYGYSRWGAPYLLGKALRGLRHSVGKVRLAIYLHETHCRPHQLGIKGPLLSPWQRYTVGTVARLGDVVFASIARYREQAIAEYGIPAERAFLLPVGTNIPIEPATPQQRQTGRKRLGWEDGEVVAAAFGSFGTQLMALRTFEDLLTRGLGRGLDRIICLGGDSLQPPGAFSEWRRKFARPASFEVLGYRPTKEVAEILACCDVGLCATPRSDLGKSTAFKAFGAAGLAVIVPPGPVDKDDQELPVFSAEEWDWSSVRSPETSCRQKMLRRHVEQTCSWDRLAREAVERMQLFAVDGEAGSGCKRE